MTSLDNLDYSSEQEIFNFVANHLLTQKRQAIAALPTATLGESVCAYRAESGTLKCAAGCLISDEDYLPEMENKNIGAVLKMYKGKSIEKLAGKLDLLDLLQQIHDAVRPAFWRENLIRLADRRGLDSTSIQDTKNV